MNIRLVTLGVLLFLAPMIVYGANASAQELDSKIDYSNWAAVLKKYVNDEGRVDYETLKENRSELDEFAQQIAGANINALTDNEQKAFWINAYNALTVKLIVDRYPLLIADIRTINWGRPWSINMKVANQKLSLGDIEHEILRKWDPIDPRIHFAINCASGGCPLLPQTPFYPENLDERLDQETKRFINDPDKVRLDREKNILYYSAIFDWFEEDFLAENESIAEYIKKYINDSDKKYLDNNKVKTKSLNYDWSLNEQK